MEINLRTIWENNCIICLQENEYKMLPINNTNTDGLSLIDQICKCTNIKISDVENNEYFPSKICPNCYMDLKIAYRFITVSEHSRNKLEALYQKLQKSITQTDNDVSKSCEDDEICEKCSNTEISKEPSQEHENFYFYDEEHISSDFEIVESVEDNENNEETNDIFASKPTVNTVDVFQESKRKALERQNKEKFQKCICDLCGNYYSQSQLKYHRMRHDKVKRFPCEICERRFATDTDLKRHMRVHTGEKPYPCQYCSRRFSDYGSRVKHERFHTGEKPYTCKTCNKSFTYSHALKKHQSVHTGYKEFVCEICTKGFTKKEYLLNHMKKHNLDQQIKENSDIEDSNKNFIKEEYIIEYDKNEESLDELKLEVIT